MSHSIRTCLWFRDGRGREAAAFYCALIPGSQIEATFDIAGDGTSWLTELTLKADKAVRAKAMAAMMKQKKIDIAAIEAAVRG